jgi:phenylpropionate dioxygenase-like ring-hydroxylating dioxygenase large terminal subunit
VETRFLLAPEAYYDDEFYEREQRSLFARAWHLAAACEDLRFPGDFVTLNVGLDPVVVIRGADGNVRAFHNFCRHRGHKLLEGTGNARTGIVCPYHFWNFGIDGELRRVPQESEFASVDLEQFGLLPAAVGEWGGMVFVNGDAGADFAAWLRDFPDHIGSYRPDRLGEVGRVQFDAQCNWKLFVENHIDVYHLWYLHAKSLSAYDHNQFEWSQVGPHWVSYEPVRAGIERKRPHVGSRPIDGLAERDRIGIGAHMLFPNMLFATEAEFFISYVAVPVAADRCTIDVRFRAEPGADAEMLVAAAKEFMLEDIAACEGVQACVRSSRFAVGPLAQHHERPITNFHEQVLELLEP